MDRLPIAIAEELDTMKYRLNGETFSEKCTRIANSLKDDDKHFRAFRDILLDQRFLPAGRVQAAMGAPRDVTPWNCFVMREIPDSMRGILEVNVEAGLTMREGGGVGYDFSTIRPRGDLIVSQDTQASGPLSFMPIFDATCQSVASAGHRRGAQMAVLRIDHPDIEAFIRAKRNSDKLTAFNISVGVTDEFMRAVVTDSMFDLVFNGKRYKTIRAASLWEEIMRSTYDWAEPGVLFLDTINHNNNLWYCEVISATNPCAEQPLPPNGACLLGSINQTKYIVKSGTGYVFDTAQLVEDIPIIVRAMDNVVDRGRAPLPEQKKEAVDKRRMGLGITGEANAIEALGYRYGSRGYIKAREELAVIMRDEIYKASVELAVEKGAFPLFNAELYGEGKFIQTLPEDLQESIKTHGIRNSHLLSIAPTGTISLTAGNVSSGIEPTFAVEYERTRQTFDGPVIDRVIDYGVSIFGNKPKVASEVTIDEHINVLASATKYVDSAVSKTCNINPGMPWNEFKNVYVKAWKKGCKGITTFNPGGKRYGILNANDGVDKEEEKVQACYIDETGKKTCD